MIKEQLTNAGIMIFFDSYYSVDAVKKYKPFRIVLPMGKRNKEKLRTQDIVMVQPIELGFIWAKPSRTSTAY